MSASRSPEPRGEAPTRGRRLLRAVLSALSALVVGLLVGALTWAGWLGWDHTASYDVVTHSVQSPYVTLQVLGCALTVALATAVLAARWQPVTGPAGVAIGFWVAWTAQAASEDETGLFVVGAALLAYGLGAGTFVVAVTAVVVRSAWDAARARRRTAEDRPSGHSPA